MAKILVQEMIAALWTPQVRLNNKANFLIISEALLYWCLPIIIFQMLRQQISRTLRRNRLQDHNLSLTNNPQGLKNTGREILMEVLQVVNRVLALHFLEPAWRTQTCKFFLKKRGMANSMVAPICNHRTTQCLTAKRKKQLTKDLSREAKVRLKTLLYFKTD